MAELEIEDHGARTGSLEGKSMIEWVWNERAVSNVEPEGSTIEVEASDIVVEQKKAPLKL